MPARCVCTHGYGGHQTPLNPIRMRPGEPIRVWSNHFEKIPLVCCDRGCDCEQYVPRRVRWIRPTEGSRKYCWMGEDGLPICGKVIDAEKRRTDDFLFEPSDHYLCVGCKRWLEAHPEVRYPRTGMEIDLTSSGE